MAQPQTKDSDEANCAARFSEVLAHMEKRFEENPEGSVSDLQPYYREKLPFACRLEDYEKAARASKYLESFSYIKPYPGESGASAQATFMHPRGARSWFMWAERGNKSFKGMYYGAKVGYVRLDFDRGIVNGQWGRRDKF
ncbi:hypothetical protein [Agrobacterium tumefaciens]|uniref:hypothetical protein n=1 Tax=Agrobacterium tumefaciens TaxID=358 RepID=UPI0039A44510